MDPRWDLALLVTSSFSSEEAEADGVITAAGGLATGAGSLAEPMHPPTTDPSAAAPRGSVTSERRRSLDDDDNGEGTVLHGRFGSGRTGATFGRGADGRSAGSCWSISHDRANGRSSDAVVSVNEDDTDPVTHRGGSGPARVPASTTPPSIYSPGDTTPTFSAKPRGNVSGILGIFRSGSRSSGDRHRHSSGALASLRGDSINGGANSGCSSPSTGGSSSGSSNRGSNSYDFIEMGNILTSTEEQLPISRTGNGPRSTWAGPAGQPPRPTTLSAIGAAGSKLWDTVIAGGSGSSSGGRLPTVQCASDSPISMERANIDGVFQPPRDGTPSPVLTMKYLHTAAPPVPRRRGAHLSLKYLKPLALRREFANLVDVDDEDNDDDDDEVGVEAGAATRSSAALPRSRGELTPLDATPRTGSSSPSIGQPTPPTGTNMSESPSRRLSLEMLPAVKAIADDGDIEEEELEFQSELCLRSRAQSFSSYLSRSFAHQLSPVVSFDEPDVWLGSSEQQTWSRAEHALDAQPQVAPSPPPPPLPVFAAVATPTHDSSARTGMGDATRHDVAAGVEDFEIDDLDIFLDLEGLDGVSGDVDDLEQSLRSGTSPPSGSRKRPGYTPVPPTALRSSMLPEWSVRREVPSAGDRAGARGGTSGGPTSANVSKGLRLTPAASTKLDLGAKGRSGADGTQRAPSPPAVKELMESTKGSSSDARGSASATAAALPGPRVELAVNNHEAHQKREAEVKKRIKEEYEYPFHNRSKQFFSDMQGHAQRLQRLRIDLAAAIQTLQKVEGAEGGDSDSTSSSADDGDSSLEDFFTCSSSSSSVSNVELNVDNAWEPPVEPAPIDTRRSQPGRARGSGTKDARALTPTEALNGLAIALRELEGEVSITVGARPPDHASSSALASSTPRADVDHSLPTSLTLHDRVRLFVKRAAQSVVKAEATAAHIRAMVVVQEERMAVGAARIQQCVQKTQDLRRKIRSLMFLSGRGDGDAFAPLRRFADFAFAEVTDDPPSTPIPCGAGDRGGDSGGAAGPASPRSQRQQPVATAAITAASGSPRVVDILWRLPEGLGRRFWRSMSSTFPKEMLRVVKAGTRTPKRRHGGARSGADGTNIVVSSSTVCTREQVLTALLAQPVQSIFERRNQLSLPCRRRLDPRLRCGSGQMMASLVEGSRRTGGDGWRGVEASHRSPVGSDNLRSDEDGDDGDGADDDDDGDDDDDDDDDDGDDEDDDDDDDDWHADDDDDDDDDGGDEDNDEDDSDASDSSEDSESQASSLAAALDEKGGVGDAVAAPRRDEGFGKLDKKLLRKVMRRMTAKHFRLSLSPVFSRVRELLPRSDVTFCQKPLLGHSKHTQRAAEGGGIQLPTTHSECDDLASGEELGRFPPARYTTAALAGSGTAAGGVAASGLGSPSVRTPRAASVWDKSLAELQTSPDVGHLSSLSLSPCGAGTCSAGPDSTPPRASMREAVPVVEEGDDASVSVPCEGDRRRDTEGRRSSRSIRQLRPPEGAPDRGRARGNSSSVRRAKGRRRRRPRTMAECWVAQRAASYFSACRSPAKVSTRLVALHEVPARAPPHRGRSRSSSSVTERRRRRGNGNEEEDQPGNRSKRRLRRAASGRSHRGARSLSTSSTSSSSSTLRSVSTCCTTGSFSQEMEVDHARMRERGAGDAWGDGTTESQAGGYYIVYARLAPLPRPAAADSRWASPQLSASPVAGGGPCSRSNSIVGCAGSKTWGQGRPRSSLHHDVGEDLDSFSRSKRVRPTASRVKFSVRIKSWQRVVRRPSPSTHSAPLSPVGAAAESLGHTPRLETTPCGAVTGSKKRRDGDDGRGRSSELQDGGHEGASASPACPDARGHRGVACATPSSPVGGARSVPSLPTAHGSTLSYSHSLHFSPPSLTLRSFHASRTSTPHARTRSQTPQSSCSTASYRSGTTSVGDIHVRVLVYEERAEFCVCSLLASLRAHEIANCTLEARRGIRWYQNLLFPPAPTDPARGAATAGSPKASGFTTTFTTMAAPAEATTAPATTVDTGPAALDAPRPGAVHSMWDFLVYEKGRAHRRSRRVLLRRADRAKEAALQAHLALAAKRSTPARPPRLP